MLRVVETHCMHCSAPTPERILADKLIRTLPENEVFGGKLRIVECGSCGLRYLNPTPDVRDLGEIYNYDVYEDSTNNNPVLMEHFHQTLTRYVPRPQRLVEIGCGTGDFLAWLQARGIANVEGVEFADSANRVKFDGPLHVGRMEEIDLPESAYDVVLLLNVIEHLSDPQAVLVKIRRMLRPGGVLLLRHPNADLFFFKPYWLCVEVPKYLMHRRLVKRGKRTGFTIAGFQNQHLFYFDRRAITRMLEAAGLRVEHFSTTDPYNRLRIGKSIRKGKLIEAGIASVRHALGTVGLGPECLSVARARD